MFGSQLVYSNRTKVALLKIYECSGWKPTSLAAVRDNLFWKAEHPHDLSER